MSRPPGIPETIPVVLVTPEMAKAWLDTRLVDYERQLRQGRVEGMARDMKDGKFRFIGDPIRFAVEGGNLEDGQHRLSAVVLSGIPQYFPVVDIPADARHVIDTGVKRSVPDMLHKLGIITGVKGKILTAIANKASAWQLGYVASSGTFRATADESITYIRRNEAALKAATDVAILVVNYRLPVAASSIGTLWYLTREVNAADADEFWVKQVIKGVGIQEDTPAQALRNRIFRLNHAGTRMYPDDALRYGALAWNHFRQGNTAAKLQAPKGGFTNRAIKLR